MADIFVKFHVDAIRSGLLHDMEPRLWTTLCVIATHIDSKGECWPRQETIAAMMNVSRTTVGKNIRDLLAFRFNGEPVITARKVRTNSGSFDNTVYTVLPASGFTIY